MLNTSYPSSVNYESRLFACSVRHILVVLTMKVDFVHALNVIFVHPVIKNICEKL